MQEETTSQWNYMVSKEEAERDKRDHEEFERYEALRLESQQETDEAERARYMDLQKLHELQTAYEQQLRALESHFRYKKLEDERGDELERRRQEEID